MDGIRHQEIQELTNNMDVSFCVFENSDDRADVFLSSILGISRSRVQKNIQKENLVVDGKIVLKNSFKKFYSRSIVEFEVEPLEEICAEPEKIQLDIIFENLGFLVVNKQPGLVVHPGAGNKSGTLINGILFHLREASFSAEGADHLRPGLVHRIDKNTSGLLVVAKNAQTFEALTSKFSVHDIEREYICLVHGRLPKNKGTVETFHGRDPANRLKFSPLVNNGRKAVTHYSVECEYQHMSLVRIRLETGRTHQIRMHMSHLGHPVVNDALYGGARKTADPVLNKILAGSNRQLLHAGKLGFALFNEKFLFSSEMPDDMKTVVDYLDSTFGRH